MKGKQRNKLIVRILAALLALLMLASLFAGVIFR